MTSPALAAPPQNQKALLPLVRRYPWLPFARYYGARSSRVADWILQEQLGNSPDRHELFVETLGDQEPNGIATCAARDWESGIYGFPMAEIPLLLAVGDHEERLALYDSLLERIEFSARAGETQHLSCRLPVEETAAVHSLQNSGFLLMDTTSEYLWRPNHLARALPKSDWEIRPAIESDHEPMAALAKEAFRERTRTRYGVDRRLPATRTGELYAEWYRNSAEGSFADCVLVASTGTMPVGFVTCKLEEGISRGIGRRVATIGLIAVQPRYEGRGVLAALVNALLGWSVSKNVQCLRTRILVNNPRSARGMLRTGAFPGASYHTFHKWLE